MNRRDILARLAAAAKEKGRELAAKHGRPLGDKLAARLSKAGVERGLLHEPLDLDTLLRRLQQLRQSGAISGEELRELGKQLREHFLHRFSKK